jgi:hypothetical protein
MGAGDEGVVLRLRVCEDAIARLRALDDPFNDSLIRDIEDVAAQLRALLNRPGPCADRPADPA